MTMKGSLNRGAWQNTQKCNKHDSPILTRLTGRRENRNRLKPQEKVSITLLTSL